MKKSKIQPYVEEFGRVSLFKKLDCKLFQLDLDKIRGNWLRLHVRWDTENEPPHKDFYKLRTAQLVASGFGRYHNKISEYVHLQFGNCKNFRLEIGIRREDGKELEYKYTYIDNLKYGVNIFFANKDWNNGNGETVLTHWSID